MQTNVINDEWLFLLWKAGIWVVEFSHTRTACLGEWPLIKTLDTKAQVSFCGCQHFICVVTHCF